MRAADGTTVARVFYDVRAGPFVPVCGRVAQRKEPPLKRRIFIKLVAFSGIGLVALSGCDTALFQGNAQPAYQPTTSAAVVWPNPSDDAEQAGHQMAPTPKPETSPTAEATHSTY